MMGPKFGYMPVNVKKQMLNQPIICMHIEVNNNDNKLRWLDIFNLNNYRKSMKPKFTIEPITPEPLAQMLSFISYTIQGPILDLFCGIGQLTKFHKPPIFGFDNKQELIKQANKNAPWAYFEELDLCDNNNIKTILQKYHKYFPKIISNPPFEKGMFTLALSSIVIIT